MWLRSMIGLAVMATAVSACSAAPSSPAGPTRPSNREPAALAIRMSCVASDCQTMPTASRLAAIAHARACTSWQLNAGSHGGPDYLVKLLTSSSDVARIRSTVLPLPGVRTVARIGVAEVKLTPTSDTHFPRPTAAPCR